MADFNREGLDIRITVEEDTKYGEFNDAIYYSYQDYSDAPDEQIDADIQAKVDAWTAMMAIPPVANVNDLQDLIILEAELQRQILDVQNQIDNLS